MDVDGNPLAAAKPFELALLDHPQEFRLQREREVRHLIEKKSAAVREFDLAVSALNSGRHSLFDAEEF